MSFSTWHTKAETDFQAKMAANLPALSVKWENVKFADPGGTYVAIVVREPGTGRQISLGSNPLHRFFGEIVVQVFDVEDAGSLGALQAASTIAGFYRGVNGQGRQIGAVAGGLITFRTPNVVEVGLRNGWFQVNVTAPYQRDVTY